MRGFAIPRRADPPAAFRGRRLRGSIDPAVAISIANAIQTQEGYYPGSLAYQNNNPGNLVYVGQAGASPGAGGFASYSSYAAGFQGLVNQITLDATRGTDVNGNPTTTLAQFLTSFAPPSENDTATYISAVSSATGFDPNASLSSLSSDADLSTGLDLSNVTDQLTSPVDLSSVGLPSVPVWGLIAAGFLTLMIVR